MRYAYSAILVSFVLLSAACGGRSAPSLWWKTIPPNCGDGVLDSDEQCDDGESNSDSTPNACRTNCSVASCGDTVVDAGEECDGNNLGGLTCENIGYNGGMLRCQPYCMLDLSDCEGGPDCGDGFCEPPENEQNCPSDCGGFCGNGICEFGEDEWSCAPDCPPGCGNGVCDVEEDPWICPVDCGFCGDGYCGPYEDEWMCPEDCSGWCGDGMCVNPLEDPWSCPEDCSFCGDGLCGPGESSANCPQDCGPTCGNGICDFGEDSWNCPQDCGWVCGDGMCSPGEDQWSCPEDCTWCGDGICGPWEDSWSCPMDCGACGNGICDPGEDQWSCPQDCGGWCGNGMCEPGEDQWSCPEDCGYCGDGFCGPWEDQWSCPQDCGTTSGWSCESIAVCAYCCAPGDIACENACAQEGGTTAQAEFQTFRSCQATQCVSECATGFDIDCLMCGWDSCPSICHYGAQGWDGCANMLNCTQGCPTIPTNGNANTCTSSQAVDCYNTCYQSGDPQAEVIYSAWMQCVSHQCAALCDPAGDPNACSNCVQNNCQFELNTCMSDW